MTPSGLTVPSMPSDTDHYPVPVEASTHCEMTNDTICWSPLRGYHHLFGCIICDTLAAHLPENQSLLHNSVVATFQRENYEFSIGNAATQDLQEELEKLSGIVQGLQAELADYHMEDYNVGPRTNVNEAIRTNRTLYEVGSDQTEQ